MLLQKSATALCVSVIALSAGQAFAGGLDRSGQGVNIIFEEGTVVQFGLSYIDPDITGTLGPTQSGDVGEAYILPLFGYKQALNDKLDFAIKYDQPFGADVQYSPTYFLSNPADPTSSLNAEATTHALTGILRYKMDGGFSIYGGLRLQSTEAEISVPAAAGYQNTTNQALDVGYLAGLAWEKPEIAARVSLTYNSSVTHDLTLTETSLFGPTTHVAEVETPQSINLDFQTGIAANTLLFGGVRWADWTATEVFSPNYLGGTPTGTLVSYDNDVITYTLGIGYKFSEKFSGAIQLGYEESEGTPVSDLGPTDGFFSIGVGGTYSLDNMKISGGIRYIDIGDAVTDNGGVFNDNDGWGVGFLVTYYFD